jgi:plastocyanin
VIRPIHLAVLALVALAACSEHTAPGAGGDSTVSVQDNLFSPQQATVSVGTTVTWTWTGSNQHNVTFNGGPASPTQTAGQYQRLFTAPGSYPYLCTVHGALMSGTVVAE